MNLTRRQVVTGGVGVTALVAGLAVNGWRHQGTDASDPALTDFWAREFDTVSGAKLATKGFKGRPLVLNFWATWCPPCVKEMPELDRFATASASRGWQVLGVAIDGREAVRQFLQSTPVGFPVVVAGTEGLSLVRALGNPSGGLPFTVVLAASGQILQRKMGATHLQELQAWAGIA